MFLLFYNRKSTYLNPPGLIYVVYVTSLPIFDLGAGVQKVSRSHMYFISSVHAMKARAGTATSFSV
jgi:hypothetical protein